MTRSIDRGSRLLGSRWWVLLLAGPVIWYLHFWLVYLLAEAICTLDPEAGTPLLLGVVAAATMLGIGAIVTIGLRRRSDDSPEFVLINRIQMIVFALGVVMVAAPAIAFPPC